MGIREDDELCGVFLTSGRDDIILGTREGMSIRFHEEDVRPMGRSAMGVRSIKLKPGDEVLDVNKLDWELVLTISENGYGKLTPASEYTRQNRGGMGIKTLNVTQKTGPVAGLKVVSGDEDLVMIDQDGTIIRINASQISVLSRLTQGVRLMRVSEGNRVVAIAVVEPDEETPEGETAETVEE